MNDDDDTSRQTIDVASLYNNKKWNIEMTF